MLRIRSAAVVVASLVVLALLSGCAALGAKFESFNRAWNGVPATLTTYDQAGALVDKVRGTSFRVTRDTKFDESGADGTTEKGDVLLISVGGAHISHVGSTLILAQDGLTAVAGGATTLAIDDPKPGTPWLNDFFYRHGQRWAGKARTIMIRSQDGHPIAVYAGNQVEVLATEVPKSTWFRVDGKYLFVYRADYTVYDNSLLAKR
ncbi:DUF5052 family protein [Actinopolymorpha alba]|uniref:DUF5052 family protein n=1 Tax=Actinopolymorpha alba TaxID=533267 RepID=UPI00037C1EA3|nr:DUF5052 family protein [Actinopolymorpha alba]